MKGDYFNGGLTTTEFSSPSTVTVVPSAKVERSFLRAAFRNSWLVIFNKRNSFV